MALYFTGVSETNGFSQSFFLPTHTRGAINIILSSSWPSSSSSSSFSSSGYQFSPVACAIYLPLLRARAHRHTHRHTRARTSGNSQSVYMYREGGGYLSPSLALSRYHCRAELQGQQRQREDRAPTPDQWDTGRQTGWLRDRHPDSHRRHHRIVMDWIRTEQPGSWWDRTAWLLFFEGGLWFRYVE